MGCIIKKIMAVGSMYDLSNNLVNVPLNLKDSFYLVQKYIHAIFDRQLRRIFIPKDQT